MLKSSNPIEFLPNLTKMVGLHEIVGHLLLFFFLDCSSKSVF